MRRVVSLLVAVACVLTAAGPVWAQQRLFVLASKELVEVDPSAASLGRVIRRVPVPFAFPAEREPVVAAGGGLLVWMAGSGFGIYDTVTNTFREYPFTLDFYSRLLGVSADGSTLMLMGQADPLGNPSTRLTALDVRDGTVRHVDLGSRVERAAYAPQSDLLFIQKFYESPGSYVEVRRAGDGSLVRTIPLVSEATFSLEVDAAGSRMFAYAPAAGLFAYDVASGALLAHTPGYDGLWVTRMVVDAYRQRLLFSAVDGQGPFLAALSSEALQPIGRINLPPAAPYGSDVRLDISPVSATLFALSAKLIPARTGPIGCQSSALTAMNVDSGAVRGVADLTAVTGTVDCQVTMVRVTEPHAPGGLSPQVTGSHVELAWRPVMATHYEIEAGSAPGATDIGRFTVTENHFAIDGVPPGTYYVRVRGVNVIGKGPASQDVRVVVP